MAIHFMDSVEMTLTVNDYERALAILNQTEVEMHKALLGAAKNSLHTLAHNIERFLRTRSEATTFKKIICDFYDEGKPEDIRDAVDWLVETQKIETARSASGDLAYKIKQIPEVELVNS